MDFSMHARGKKKLSWTESAADAQFRRKRTDAFPLPWQRLSGPPKMLHQVPCHRPRDLCRKSHLSDVERVVEIALSFTDGSDEVRDTQTVALYKSF